MKFCVKCGKDIESGVLCHDCQAVAKEIIDVMLPVCGCGKYFSRNMWLPCKDEVDAVLKFVKDKYGGRISRNGLQFDGKKTYEADLEDRRIFVRIAPNKCGLCSRKGEYFEAILQLRCKNQENLGECIRMMEHELKSVKKKGIFINKIEEQKDGADLYITCQKYIQELARKAHARFGGVLKINPRLFSRNKQTSRNIYRVNVYLELPDFSQSDVLQIGRTPAKVSKLGKRILCRDLASGKQKILIYGKDEYKILKRYETMISSVLPHAQAINPVNFQSERVENPGDEKINEKITVVICNGLYIVRNN